MLAMLVTHSNRFTTALHSVWKYPKHSHLNFHFKICFLARFIWILMWKILYRQFEFSCQKYSNTYFRPLCKIISAFRVVQLMWEITHARQCCCASCASYAIASSRSTLDLAGAEPSPLPAANWYRGMVHLQNKLLIKWFHSQDFILLC